MLGKSHRYSPLMANLQNKVEAEYPQWILWLPVAFGAGVGGYFSLLAEPPFWVIGLVLGFLAVAGMFAWRRVAWRWLWFMCLFMACGFAVTQARTHLLYAPKITRFLPVMDVSGVVDKVEPRGEGLRLTLKNPHLAASDVQPEYATLSFRKKPDTQVNVGDEVAVKAGFFPLSAPSYPWGYAFDRHFYFKQIGAMGYVPNPATLQVTAQAKEQAGLITQVRQDMARQLEAAMPTRTASVATALMVGEQGGISDEVMEAMRRSGLVHILSISGLHLTLAAMLLFIALRVVFAAIPPIAERWDAKPLAAIGALVSSFLYLQLAGSPISAERSFIMVAMVLLAVIFRRQVAPMRSIALAAFVLLLFTPEALLNPGFQLSFAATLALVSYYEHWRDTHREDEEKRPFSYLKLYITGSIVTSFIATLATTPLIFFHFEQVPLYSMLANLLASLLVSYIIMPLVVIALVLYPVGGFALVLTPLSYAIEMMIRVGEWTSALPFATFTLAPLSTGALCVIVLSGLWLLLWKGRWRFWGMAGVMIGFVPLWFYEVPQVVISPSGQQVAIALPHGGAFMLKGAQKGFTQDGWKRFLLIREYTPRKQVEGVECNKDFCRYQNIVHITNPKFVRKLCAPDMLVVLPRYRLFPEERKLCKHSVIFDRDALQANGAVALFRENGGWRVVTTRNITGNRPWR